MENLIRNILLTAEENGGEFPNLDQCTEAERRVIECVLRDYEVLKSHC